MATLDWLIVALYLGVVGGLAAWVFSRRKDTPDDYFLANRNLGWFIVGASIFASNIGSEHLVGLAGSGATDGVALAHYELHAWCLLVLAWVFVPFFMRSHVYTMPEFLERRFSPAARWVLSLISLVSYVLTKIAVGIFAGGVVFATLLPDVQSATRPVAPEQLLGGFPGRDRADGDLHRRRRNARRRLHRGAAGAGAGGGLGTADLVRTVGSRGLGRTQGSP